MDVLHWLPGILGVIISLPSNQILQLFALPMALLVRAFVDHCVLIKENACLERVPPVATAHAFCIQDAYNSLLDSLATAEEAGGDEEVDLI